MTIAGTDGNIDVLVCEIDMMHGGRYPKVDLGMGFGKSTEPVNQPLGGEIWRRTHGQHARALPLHEALGSIGDAIESVAHDRQVVPASLSDAQSLPFAVEKLDAEFRLQRFDLLTQRPLGGGKLLGGGPEARRPGVSLAGPKRVELRQAAGHRPLLDFMRKTQTKYSAITPWKQAVFSRWHENFSG